MAVCPTCQRELDEASVREGRCSDCGARWRQLPQRTVSDVRAAEAEAGEETPEGSATIEASAAGEGDGRATVDDDTMATVDLSSDQAAGPPRTVAFTSEQTVEFLGGSPDPEATLVASQWGENIAGTPSNSRATIKQKETVSGSFMSSSSLVVKSRHVRPTGSPTTQLASPADAPDYELLNVIGEGGMGVVYAARQSSIARTVAVKMLKGDDSTSAMQREKFISEAVVTGELDHPNIVPIYDLGANDQGALFYSMKRVKGTPWNKAIKDKSLDENLTILLRMADAVAFAHVNGVIHRDLKPENVMLGDFGEVLVMDWGLARVSPEFPNAASVSQSDAMGGTPAYMAPEMATGPLEKISTASDVYLLGAILFEIITGRPPHSGKTVMACLFSAAKNQIVETEQNGELMEIALKAMSTEPVDRHGSVPEFQREVRRYQSHSESILLTENAERYLSRAAEAEDYELYARAIYGFEESLALWPENKRAGKLLARARIEYARLALAKGDFDLGASLLDPKVEAHGEILAQLESGRRERESRQRRIRLLKGAVAALIVAVIGIVSIAYAAVSKQRDAAVYQRDLAERQRVRAVAAEGEAIENAQAAEEARDVAKAEQARAEEGENRAVKAEGEAKTNLEKAVVEQRRAEREKEEADRQRKLAEAARNAEEYAAYVARIGLAKSKIDENAFDRASELLSQCKPELRHWEWGRLSYLCQLSAETWRATAPVDSAALSPDGRHFATGDWDGNVTIWDRQTGKPLHAMPLGQYVHSVAYDATGERLAAGSSNGTVRVYRAADGERLADLEGHAGAVLCVRFSPDGATLLSCGRDQTARWWDLATGKEKQALHGHSWWVWTAEFSPRGDRIVTAGQDGKTIVWKQGGGDVTGSDGREAGDSQASADVFRRETEFTAHRGPVYAAKFSPDGERVASAGYDGRVLLWSPVNVSPVDIERRLEGKPDLPIEFQEFAGHRAPVRAVTFAPDGRSLATGGQDNAVIVWDVKSGEATKTLRGHASYVASCEYSADGQSLLSAGRDSLVKLWRPEDYAETRLIAAGGEDGEAVLEARFSPDGASIVTASRDRTASLWDAQSLERVQQFQEGHEFLASAAVFFDGGARLATSAGDGTVRGWDVATGAEVLRCDGTGRTAALDVGGGRIATGSSDNAVQIWNAENGEKVAALEGHQSEVTAVRFAPGGELLASGDDRGRCRLWRYNAATNSWVGGAWLRGHSRTITAMAFSDDGATLITASGDNTCGQWDVAKGEEIPARVLKHPDWVADMVVSRDGTLALTACDDGFVRLWSLAEAQVLRTFEPPTPGTAFTSIDLSADGRLATAACAAHGTVRVWNLETGREIGPVGDDGSKRAWLDLGGRGGLIWAARFAPDGDGLLAIGGNDARLFDIDSRRRLVRFSPHGAVASADVSPDGKRIVTGSWDRSAKIWDVETGNVVAKLDGQHQGYVNSAVFSPDGERVLTASDDGTARLWNAADGRPLEPVFRGHQDRIRQACFSPDGSRVLTVSNDKSAIIFDAATGEALLTLSGHEWGLRSGAFSADGRRVITGSDDNAAIVWDAATGEQIAALRGHTGAVTSVALTPDGARALTGSEDNAVKLWDADTSQEILTLAGHADEVTSVCFSPDGLQALTSGRDGKTLLWPSVAWDAAK